MPVPTALPWIDELGLTGWTAVAGAALLALLLVLLVHRIGTAILRRIVAPLPFSRRLVEYGNRSGRLIVFLLVLQVILRSASDALPGIDTARHLNALLLTGALTWFGVRCVGAVSDTIIELNPAHAADNLRARRVQTQARVLARSLMVLIILIGTGIGLMTLPMVRQIGASLLASAGVAGLVVGFAAKPVLGNLLAGLQLALTQPIRLQDVVIVENEWGWVEEITGTYVVIRVWDLRRLIVPLQWFIEHPFQNWTRTNADILGSVFLWVDYRMPLAPLRIEAERLCREAPEWDGKVCVTQVVENSERAMQLRILVSASDSPRAWDLRCRVREGLVSFVARDYPQYLPRIRAELGDAPDGRRGP